MASFVSSRLFAFAAVLVALTLLALRGGDHRSYDSVRGPEASAWTTELTIPIEVIEAGEAPDFLELRVRH